MKPAGSLTRRLALDLETVDSGKDKQEKKTEEEQYLLWLHLVPQDQLPSQGEVRELMQYLEVAGFRIASDNGMISVVPADVVSEERVFQTCDGVAAQLASEGGGIVFRGRGAGIALVCDPHARTHADVIRRTHLDDEALFGEFQVWMPAPDPQGVTHDEAADAILEVMPKVMSALQSVVTFAITTDDLAQLFLRWPYHRQVSKTSRLSELFWYQAFKPEAADDLPIEDYRRAGCTVETRRDGITIAQIGALPSVALPKLEAARDRWVHGVVPRRVC